MQLRHLTIIVAAVTLACAVFADEPELPVEIKDAIRYMDNPPSTVPLTSYLMDRMLHSNADKDEVAAMMEIMDALHAQQHPIKESCATRRLLVMQVPVRRFEGLGSFLKGIILGLAEAAYENRTLIWGLDQSLIVEMSRDAWINETGSAKRDFNLTCDWKMGGGSYGCLFMPLSSCSLTDLTWKELRELGYFGHNDTSRVRLVEARRGGPAAYMPPRNRFSYNGQPSTPLGSSSSCVHLPPKACHCRKLCRAAGGARLAVLRLGHSRTQR
jgi:hypothetical protein